MSDNHTLRCFTDAEAAKILHVCVRKVRALRATGDLFSFYVGRSVRIPDFAITDYIRANGRHGGSQDAA